MQYFLQIQPNMKKKDENTEQDESSASKQNNKEEQNLDIKTEVDKEELTIDQKLEKEIDDLKKQLDESKDKYLRLFAEFDNYKKRTNKERIEWIKAAGMEVIISMLPVLDDFERGLKQMENALDVQSLKEGKQLIYNKLKTQLEQRGLQQMETIGKEFNPELHDAISEVSAPSEEMKGKVMDEIEKGYYLNDVLIRHAKVVVGK